MRRTTRLAALLPVLCSATGLADVIDVPADHPTIQAAITAALPGDEVVVAPGTYLETIDLLGKAITVRGSDPSDWSVVEATIIDGSASGTVVQIMSGEGRSTVLSGLVVTNGLWGVGGGIRVDDSSPTISRCIIRDNEASLGAGISVAYGGDPLIDDCIIRDNVATGHPAGGGGIANVSGSQADVSNTMLCGNVPEQIHGNWDDLGGNELAERCAEDCPADLDGDGGVAVGDLLALLAAWGTADPSSDIDGSGVVDTVDLLALLAAWGACP